MEEGRIVTLIGAKYAKVGEEFFFLGLSEEHTSELQSLAYLVCRLLLEKKNRRQDTVNITQPHKAST